MFRYSAPARAFILIQIILNFTNITSPSRSRVVSAYHFESVREQLQNVEHSLQNSVAPQQVRESADSFIRIAFRQQHAMQKCSYEDLKSKLRFNNGRAFCDRNTFLRVQELGQEDVCHVTDSIMHVIKFDK